MKKTNNKLLIVIDMQNDFVNGTLGTEQAGAIVDKVANKIKSWKGLILATQDTHYDDTYLDSTEGKNLPVKHCIKNSFGWQITSKVKKALDAKNVIPIEKTFFTSTVLPTMIKAFNCHEVELIGLCTDICVISNALYIKATLPDVTISVDSSCCAGVTPELHQNALNVMKSCQIEIK